MNATPNDRLRAKLQTLSKALDDEEWAVLHTVFALAEAAMQLEETQMGFNLQYLQLQQTMQDENRAFTMVSNIMKTRHDTVRNTISNIR